MSKVQFFVDGNSVGTASQAPWQVTWNSASVANGSHTITATATDSAGNSATSAPATVTVNNYPPPTTSINPLPNGGSGLMVRHGAAERCRPTAVLAPPSIS